MIFLMVLIWLMAISGYMLCLIHLKINLLSSAAIAFSIIVFLLYCFALFGYLQLGVYVTDALGIGLFFWCLRPTLLFIKKQILLGDVCILMYAIPVTVVLASIPQDYQFTYWDEFANWGLTIKYMFAQNQLHSFADLDYFTYRHYPPIQQLFQYYFIWHFGWSERAIMVAQMLLILGLQMSIFAVPRNKYVWGAMGFTASLLLPWYFNYVYNNIYADALLALYFSATLFWIFTSKETRIHFLITCLMVFVLTLIKQVGLVLGAIAILVYLTKWAFISRSFILNAEISSMGLNALRPLSIFATLIISFESWNLFRKIYAIPVNKSEAIPPLAEFISGPLAERMQVTLVHFWQHNVMSQLYQPSLLFYQVIAVLFLISMILPLFVATKDRIRQAAMLVGISLGALAYIAFTVLSFIVFFSEWEGVRLQGFDRYLGIYLVAWSVLLLGLLVQYCLVGRLHQALLLLTCSSFLVICPPKLFWQKIFHIELNPVVLSDRHQLNELAQGFSGTPANTKIFFISQGDNGFLTRIFHYSITPRGASTECRSFPRIGVDDPETCKKTLAQALQGYDFLMLYQADPQFWADYGKYFSEHSDRSIYQIRWKEDSPILSKWH
jgi:hypothetical protein